MLKRVYSRRDSPRERPIDAIWFIAANGGGKQSVRVVLAMSAAARRILAALWFFQLVNYCDRVVISFVAPDLMQSLQIGPAQYGLVMSCFAAGYLLAQVPGGILADRLGVRVAMVAGPLLWAVLTGGVGLVSSLFVLLILRFCFGLAEGMSNPSAYKVIGDTFPPQQRSWASGIFATSLAVGPAIVGPLVAWLLHYFEWRQLFFLLALPALATAAVNVWVLPRRAAEPGGHRTPAPNGHAGASLKAALRDRHLWLIACNYLGFACAFFGLLSWLPSYLGLARHIDVKNSALLGGIPYANGVGGMLLLGWLAKGQKRNLLCVQLAVCQLLAALFLLGALLAPTTLGSLVGLSGAAFFLFGCFSLAAPLLLLIAPPHSRAAYGGIYSIFGQVGGVLTPAAIGFLVAETGSFAGGFAFMIGGLVVASLCAAVMAAKLPGVQSAELAYGG